MIDFVLELDESVENHETALLEVDLIVFELGFRRSRGSSGRFGRFSLILVAAMVS